MIWNKGKTLVPRESCLNCGNKFYAQPKLKRRTIPGGKFCSHSCCALYHWRDKHSFVKITCKRCGKEFEVLPNQKGRKYCSRSCSAGPKGAQLNPRKTRAKTITTQMVICKTCSKSFEVKIWYLKKGQGRYCSLKCWGGDAVKSGHMNKVPGSGRGGKRPDLENRYFRSRWEANYARYLNWMIRRDEIASWQFEPDTYEFPVKRGSKFYTPDFKVFDKDGNFVYHEVKGYMDPSSATKLKRMSKYYPSIKVEIIGHDTFRQLNREFSRLLPGWESPTAKHSY